METMGMETILIVTGNEEEYDQLALVLSKKYCFLHVNSEEEFLQYYFDKKEKIVLCLVGEKLLDCLGIELLEKISKSQYPQFQIRSKVPIAFLMNQKDDLLMEEVFEYGVADVIEVPYQNALLLKRVANLIKMHKGSLFEEIVGKDYLTKVLNKETFYTKLDHMIDKGLITDTIVVGVMIDKYKILTELYGGDQGDKLLVYVSKRLQDFFADAIFIGRVEIDYFVLYIKKTDIRERFDLINDELELYPLSFRIILKGAEYELGHEPICAKEAIHRTMYVMDTIRNSKEKNYSVYNNEIKDFVELEETFSKEMKDALEQGQFQVYYQPKVDLVSHKMIGAEALVRWLHPVKGVLSPKNFIPVFEKNGFVATLDAYVWEQVCIDLVGWMEEKIPTVPISVNVSKGDLYNYNLYEILYQLITLYNIPVSMLQLEITENTYMENKQQAIDVVAGLKELGFSIIMDDFGIGYSSINSIKDVPLDILKLDLAYLYELQDEEKSKQLIESIVTMANHLGIDVIAEGLEHNEQIEFLKSIGCTKVQGHLFDKALPKQEFEKKLQNL